MKRKTKVLSLILLLTIILSSTSSWASSTNETVKFRDVKSTDWFYSTVTKLVEMGGINGYPDNTFKPNNTISVAEFIKITVASLGYDEKVNENGYWASNYINKAIEIGLVHNGEFREDEYNNSICRNRMARILVRAVEHRKEELPRDYKEYEKYITDFKYIPEEYKEYILKTYSRELIDGYNDGTFRGANGLTRAEAATVIIRIFDETERVNVKDKETPIITEYGPNVDLRKVPIVGEGKSEIRGPKGEDNPHNADFGYIILLYKPVSPQYKDAESLLNARFGKGHDVIKEIMKYIETKDTRDKKLELKEWTVNGQLIMVSSSSNSMDIGLQVWRAE